MNAAPVFDRVYGGLKHLLRSGTIVPGTRLDPARYAEQLAASVTPVRDALHRLAGEHMVLATHDGFQVPSPSEPDLRDLYDWQYQLLQSALRTSRRTHADFLPELPAEAHLAEVVEQLFSAIANAAPNLELRHAVAASGDRLHAVRRAETLVLPGLAEELSDLIEADLRTLRTRLGRYHRRRIAAASETLRALYRAAG
ncbi:GntR family transcriptional regulator [Sphingomonas sp. KR3-1]|uniref:GntR family transcriptional regulator n=1 Tax=Sphingomonas sp. KR3-1 TaxID=3156611 RepID=UPI0032B54D93